MNNKLPHQEELDELKQLIPSKKQLAILLSQLKTFPRPRIDLEQYSSDGDVAASLLWRAFLQGDIFGKHILDLGAGTGLLGIGALLLGAAHVTFVDIDAKAQTYIKENIKLLEDWELTIPLRRCTYIESDVRHLDKTITADTVIMNPPFGTKRKHADKLFLQQAIIRAPVVYSMHKTSTEAFLDAFARTQDCQLVWQEDTSFPIKNTQKIHRKKIQRIEVRLICLKKNQ
ncbi:MAG: METTL5 family protein [Candidatus Woesearchaeota archaeon]